MKHKKSKQRRKFNETHIGYLLEHITPLEYRLILEAGGVAPPPDLIEALSYSSLDPFFRTDEFRQALMEYRKTGLRPFKALKPNANKELYYIRLRQRKAKELAAIEKF